MFITIEGIEGSGKTTQIHHILNFLKEKGLDCIFTREPGGTPLGEKIRAILLDAKSEGLDPITELLLYTADRVQHIRSKVVPALDAGKTVLCDRYFDATMAYQGYARGLDIGLIQDLHRMMVKNIMPDVTLLLDLPVELGLSRAWEQIDNGSRSGNETRFEEEKLEFHENVRAGYLEIAKNEPDRFRVIDASKSEEEVKQAIFDALLPHV